MIRAVKHNQSSGIRRTFQVGSSRAVRKNFWPAVAQRMGVWSVGEVLDNRKAYMGYHSSQSLPFAVRRLVDKHQDRLCGERARLPSIFRPHGCIMSQAQVSGCSWSTAGCSQARISGATSLPRPTSSTRSRRTMCTRWASRAHTPDLTGGRKAAPCPRLLSSRTTTRPGSTSS